MSDLTETAAVLPYHFKNVTYTAPLHGAAVIFTGAVHGDEVCGTHAILRMISEIESGQLQIKSGMVTFVPVTNPLAYQRGEHTGERNLNRKLMPTLKPGQFEDYVANWLCPLLAQHDVLLDLHSFDEPGDPFVMVGPENNRGPLEAFQYAEKEQALALRLGVRRLVDGWLSAHARGENAQFAIGTAEYMRSVGGYGLTVECGQHRDAQAQEVAYQAMLNTLRFLDMLGGDKPQRVSDVVAIRLINVVEKLHEDDSLSRSWSNFDAVVEGDIVAIRHDGSQVVAESDGYVLLPDSHALAGGEWFYLAKAHTRFL